MLALEPTRTAFVVVDMLNWQVPKDVPPGAYWNQYYVDRCWDLVVPQHQRLLPAARAAGAKVAYLQVGAQRDDYGDVLRQFRVAFAHYGARIGTWACEVIDELAPEPGDAVLPKRGSGGFTTSALDATLRGWGVDTVVYTGVVTNCCVMLTAAAGYDHEYTGYVVSDATAAFSDDLQAAAELALGAMAATITTTDDVLAALGAVARAG